MGVSIVKLVMICVGRRSTRYEVKLRFLVKRTSFVLVGESSRSFSLHHVLIRLI